MDTIKTSRLLLEPFTYQLMLAAVESAAKFSRQSGFAVADDWPNPDLKDALPFIAAAVGKNSALEEWSRLLVLPGKHARSGVPLVIGEAGFKGLPDSAGVVEIGYGVATSHRARGYASEAVSALCVWAFQHKHVTRIRAECLPTNAGSIGVLRRTGFRETDSHAQMLHWELTPPPRM
jgi:ribosomal-protein-alanine N-acetyltransferase